MNYAAVLSKSEKKSKTTEKISEKKSKATLVQELLQNGNCMAHKQIAEKVGCHKVYVAQVKKAKTIAEQAPWYEKHVSEALLFDPSDQPITYTSNLSSQVPLREISREERAENILNIRDEGDELEHAKNTKQSLRRALFQGARKESFHGFVEVEQSMSEEDSKAFDKILDETLPAMLANKTTGAAAAYGACFSPIFEYAQLAPLGPGEERGDAEKEDDRRMGDKKRSQAKLSALLETASARVKDAQADVDKCTCKRGKRKRGVDRALASVKKEEALLLDLLRLMRKHYDCVREVRKSISMLKEENLKLSRSAGVAGKGFEGSGTRPGPFRHHSLRE